MSELAGLLRFLREADAAGERVALAHLVEVRGSHYRRPEALLASSDGLEPKGELS